MALVYEIAEEGESNVPSSEVRLASVNSGYLLAGYIPSLRDVVSEKKYHIAERVYKNTAESICYWQL